jgi:hypothetical protein
MVAAVVLVVIALVLLVQHLAVGHLQRQLSLY